MLFGVIKINCDMCGRDTQLFKADIEGTILNVCGDCSRFGKIIKTLRRERTEIFKKKEVKQEKPKEEIILSIVGDYGDIIKKKREELGISQEDFAKKINEKISLIHKIEVNQLEPNIELANKIEKFLHIHLIEQQELQKGSFDNKKRDFFTIGDFIKVKK